MFKFLIATVLLSFTSIPGMVEWNGPDPYPREDWSHTVPELYPLVLEFEEKWGEPLEIRQVYRPAEYGAHLRSVWEIWRWMNGESFKEGYQCEDYEHFKPEDLKSFSYFQRKIIENEAKLHGFWPGGTPPACNSDHALGIAVDITPPKDWALYRKWVATGVSVGLCHYIPGDEPHFAVLKYLSTEVDCLSY